ncbi:hypothetical protein KIN20_010818 [Parelaphostrongylus tenuis]|uniref:Uncharacterized protein n=1 Tax=Parelaphostrongylus tenuis TaxID=148309 RepID=A0AAD5MU27_PARTN|nr:hypothetical protein KIN20_010818 [Parelaphostrongylus tenuis]
MVDVMEITMSVKQLRVVFRNEADFNKKGDSEEETKNYVQKFRVRSILQDFPPPMEYHQLPPIEKVAYLFYVAVYKKLYSDVGDFHRVFNREYHKYTCDDEFG